MNIRKLLHYPSKEQRKLVLSDVERIQKRCDEIVVIEAKEQTENAWAHDNICPNCKAKYDKIVDRFAYVQGKSNVTGYWFKIKSVTSLETYPVNHCSVCGNEWEKFKTKAITETNIVKVVLNYLSDVINEPEKNKKRLWKHETIEMFNDCHAESICFMQKKYKNWLHKPVCIKVLRKKYSSIYEKSKK